MSICNLSNFSSILFKHTSYHDSHTEVHQPSSISKSTTSHHTSSGHHLYEGDLVSKTSNLNEFSISSNWGLGLGFSGEGGGRKKKSLWDWTTFSFFRTPPEKPRPNLLEIEDSLPTPRAIFFRPPPSCRGGARQAQLLEIEDSLRLEALEIRSPS